MTDGNISKKQAAANLTVKDKDWIESIRDCICPEKPLILDRQYYKLSITNKDIVSWLQDNKCTTAKTFTLDLPDIPLHFLPDFIRGIIDGDGSISFKLEKKNKISCNLLGASKTFMIKFSNLLKNIGFKFSFMTLKNGRERTYKNNSWNEKEYYRINFYGTNTYKFLKWIYYPNNELSLKRKEILANKIINYYENDKNNFIKRELNVGCKISWPNNDLLIEMINKNGYAETGRQLSVSDGSIRNRLKTRDLLKYIK